MIITLWIFKEFRPKIPAWSGVGQGIVDRGSHLCHELFILENKR